AGEFVPIEQFATDDELKGKLAIILQTWPLYRVCQYKVADAVTLVPKYLRLFCDSCKTETIWETTFYSNENCRDGFEGKRYQCRNCSSRTTSYYFYWKKGEQH